MGIVTDSTPVEDPKDPDHYLFQLFALFADPCARAAMAERARAGGLGYGDVKKEIFERLMDHFAPMRARREDYEKRPGDVEAILADGARRARALAAPVMEACRQAAGVGPSRR
jgi:tryptophanyl-tRNA synthetase